MFIFNFLLTLVSLLTLSLVNAAETTPSHVYQTVDNVANVLSELHRENESEVIYNDFKIEGRRPRHVIQKAREAYLKLQILRKFNGLEANPVPPFLVIEITPGNVLDMVNLILRDVKELRPVFGVDVVSSEAILSSDKTPNDVYLNLVRVVDMLESLDIPVTVPNNVYQIAETIINDVELISNKRGIQSIMRKQSASTDKKPVDAYNQALELINEIKNLCNKNQQFCLTGGVIVPQRHVGDIHPAHVIDMLNNALAELGSIKTNLGIQNVTVISAAVSGKTPSDVYDEIFTARAMLKDIN